MVHCVYTVPQPSQGHTNNRDTVPVVTTRLKVGTPCFMNAL